MEHTLSPSDFTAIAKNTAGYSASDLTNLAKDASMGPIRDCDAQTLGGTSTVRLRPIRKSDFDFACKRVRASTSSEATKKNADWNRKFGQVLA